MKGKRNEKYCKNEMALKDAVWRFVVNLNRGYDVDDVTFKKVRV